MSVIDSSTLPPLIQQKLAQFETIQQEFIESFLFVQEVHGQKVFSTFPVSSIVRYLHALWMCECKTCLLSVPKTVKEYEGEQCLQLLAVWQKERDTASVVKFLQKKLDMLPLGEITSQIQRAQQAENASSNVQSLLYGRKVMLQRGKHLLQALDTLFSLSEQQLAHEIDEACVYYQHRPEQIEQQLALLQTPLYSYMPHQVLAQCNMLVMNTIGARVAKTFALAPDQRSWSTGQQDETFPEEARPLAEHNLPNYLELTAPRHNNLLQRLFKDRPEQSQEAYL